MTKKDQLHKKIETEKLSVPGKRTRLNQIVRERGAETLQMRKFWWEKTVSRENEDQISKKKGCHGIFGPLMYF